MHTSQKNNLLTLQQAEKVVALLARRNVRADIAPIGGKYKITVAAENIEPEQPEVIEETHADDALDFDGNGEEFEDESVEGDGEGEPLDFGDAGEGEEPEDDFDAEAAVAKLIRAAKKQVRAEDSYGAEPKDGAEDGDETDDLFGSDVEADLMPDGEGSDNEEVLDLFGDDHEVSEEPTMADFMPEGDGASNDDVDDLFEADHEVESEPPKVTQAKKAAAAAKPVAKKQVRAEEKADEAEEDKEEEAAVAKLLAVAAAKKKKKKKKTRASDDLTNEMDEAGDPIEVEGEETDEKTETPAEEAAEKAAASFKRFAKPAAKSLIKASRSRVKAAEESKEPADEEKAETPAEEKAEGTVKNLTALRARAIAMRLKAKGHAAKIVKAKNGTFSVTLATEEFGDQIEPESVPPAEPELEFEDEFKAEGEGDGEEIGDDEPIDETEMQEASYKYEPLATASMLQSVVAADVDMVLHGANSENPRWNVLIKGSPVAAIELMSLPDHEKVRATFVTAKWSDSIKRLFNQTDALQVLQAVNATFYVNQINSQSYKQRVRNEVKAELEQKYASARLALKDKMVEAIHLAIAGINNGFWRDEGNTLKQALFANLQSCGVVNPETVIEASFDEGADYWKTVIAKAEELMSKPAEVRKELGRAIAGSGNMAVASASNVSFARRLEASAMPVTANAGAAPQIKTQKDAMRSLFRGGASVLGNR